MIEVDSTAARHDLLDLLVDIDEAARIALGFAVKEAVRSIQITDLYQDKTGKTRASVKSEVDGLTGFVHSGGMTRFLENGTAPHTITARRAPVLRFKMNGQWISKKSVNHPGTRPHPFMRVAWAEAQEVAELQAEHFVNAAIARHHHDS